MQNPYEDLIKQKSSECSLDLNQCSGGRIRTYDHLLTFIPMFPLGTDYIIFRFCGIEALPQILFGVLPFGIVSTPSQLQF